ncbi:MAG: proton-conducting transporter membrane subunit [Nitrospiria bacterium]
MITLYYPLIIFLAPLIAALIIGFSYGLDHHKVYRIGVLAQVFALLVALQVLYSVVNKGPIMINFSLFPFAANGIFQFGFNIDRLAALMMVHITAVSTIVYVFSIRYMQQDHKFNWFFSLLSLTTFVLLCMISSSNLLMLFFFWQILGWLLCLLSHNYSHPTTVRGANRTFFMLRVGDVAFLLGILLAYNLYGTVDISKLFDMASRVHASFSLLPWGGMEISGATAVTLLIFIGAMSKSAQFPFHMWLPDSLYAPTPVHALLHAGIINVGGFLLNRLAPLFGESPTTLHLVFTTGALTALLGAGMMLTQNDIKKTLGYSTIGQMGYMIMECGLGAFALAIFHLIAHGLFKATIFLNCGNLIHSTRLEPRVPTKDKTLEQGEFSLLTWLTGFIATLVLPLIILLVAHGVLSLPLRNSQGIVIFLFFSWVTSSQAILTLYRLRAVASPKISALMLLTLLLVVLTYLMAAQAFMYFLYPETDKVAAYFNDAALPEWIFDVIVETMALAVMLNWFFIYAKSHGKTLRMPEWVNKVETIIYLLFMNRLYLDSLSLKFKGNITSFVNRLDKSRFFLYITGLIALGMVLPGIDWTGKLSAINIVFLIFIGLTIPLFPLHGVYLFALTRLPGNLSVIMTILLPTMGMYGLNRLLPQMPADFLSGLGVLAMFGIFYGSFKALVQTRVNHLLAYAGLSFFSFLWWFLSITGKFTPQAVVFAWSVTLVMGGLRLAWQRVETRYGKLNLGQLGGIAETMPLFASLLALLVMAAMGLPPFGLFSGYMAMLTYPSIKFSWSLVMGILTWLMASRYLFRLMQRILFGPNRPDLIYDDLHPAEASPLLIVLVILLILGMIPYGYFETGTFISGSSSTMELLQWNR